MAACNQTFRSLNGSNPLLGETPPERLRILVVGDENSTLEIPNVTLQSAGYHLCQASSGKEAVAKLHKARPDLILLSIRLPDMEGKQVLQQLRDLTPAPVIAMSVRHEDAEQIACLDTGADGYFTKLMTKGELLARLRAAFRRRFGILQSQAFTVGNLTIDFSRRKVFVRSEQVKLTETEYDVLKILARRAGLVTTHHQLVHEVWGTTHYQDVVHLLRVTVSNLRRKLAAGDPKFVRYIVTIPRVGYRLRTDFDQTQNRERAPISRQRH